MTGSSEITVLLAGFGGPETLGHVPEFVESVLGRTPPSHVIPEVVDRYRLIGGGSPLPATTRNQGKLLEKELGERGHQARVHVGMLHAPPTITEAADRIVADGVADLVVISLAPYRCEVSTDAYYGAVADALDDRVRSVKYAADWNLEPRYLDALADMLGTTLRAAPDATPVVFAAHSLPQRMIDQGDPYATQLNETAEAVAARLGLSDWQIAYQSVSAAAREPWLRPSVEEAMDGLVADGVTSVVVDPIGFIADHVETLYDNDVEHRAHADSVGLEFHRCLCLNEHPGLIAALADVVEGTA
jgi:protoporphyrin/coproporphyrin ferrochelatase